MRWQSVFWSVASANSMCTVACLASIALDLAKIWNFSHSPNAPAAMVPAMHAECACCRGTCYACTPNAPAAVVPAMHAECACCRGTCYARRMRLLRALLNREPNGFTFFLFVFVTNRNTHPLFVKCFCHSMAEKAFAFLLLSLPPTPLLPTQV